MTLNLELARPVPDFSAARRRLGQVLRDLPAQETDEGALEELVREIGEFAPARGRANTALLRDD
jgi:hypothetical protein